MPRELGRTRAAVLSRHLSLSAVIWILLLQDDLIAFFESTEQFGLGSVRDADLNRSLGLTVFTLWIRHFDGGFLILVVDDGALGNREDSLVFVENDLGVGGHHGLEFSTGVGDGNADLEGRDVILFDTHGRDLGDLAGEALVLKGLDLDTGWLSKINIADIAFVHLAEHVNLARIAD